MELTAVLIAKLGITPIFIVIVSLVIRTAGPKAGGLLAGLPLTSAPISVFLAVEQDTEFAAEAAIGSVGAVSAIGLFCVAYARAALVGKWFFASVVGVTVYLIVVAALGFTRSGLAIVVGMTISVLLAALFYFPIPAAGLGKRAEPRWDLPARATIATAMVFLVTGAAPLLGPYWAGLLAPYPVFATVLAAFTHVSLGHAASIRLLRGVLLASFGFVGFFLVIALTLPILGLVLGYSMATLAALGTVWVGIRIDRIYA